MLNLVLGVGVLSLLPITLQEIRMVLNKRALNAFEVWTWAFKVRIVALEVYSLSAIPV